MDDLLRALVLGVVQGMTEFIPVSSSGHLVLVPWLLNWESPGLVFDTTVHIGTLVGVLVYFWRDVREILVAWFVGWQRREWKDPAGRLGWLIIVGTIPAGVLGLAFEDWFESLFGQPGFVAAALLVTGLILAVSERLSRRKEGLASLTVLAAVVIGFAQAGAIIPGISRSGATIAAGLGLGLTRTAAARFSFLLAMPIIAAAGLAQLVQVAAGTSVSPGAAVLATGFVGAGLSGYGCIRFLLSYLQRGTLYVFALHCWFFGIFALLRWNGVVG